MFLKIYVLIKKCVYSTKHTHYSKNNMTKDVGVIINTTTENSSNLALIKTKKNLPQKFNKFIDQNSSFNKSQTA